MLYVCRAHRCTARWLWAACLLTLMMGSVGFAQSTVDDGPWNYRLRQPADGWQQPGFDDGDWREGAGGFGEPSTPGARVGTLWKTDNIWLRKTVQLDPVPQRPALLIHHDEDAQVYLNGQQVADLKGFVTEYQVVPLEGAGRSALKAGSNLLAVHCRQTTGGQFIDVHLVDADNVPELPPAKRSTTPFQSELITRWGEQVTADNAWTEYPRPQMTRQQWQNLNGHWDYAITPLDQQDPPSEWAGKILVPFPLESRLSGVQRLLDAGEALWYRRSLDFAPRGQNRAMLNFEAVDYRCQVWINGLPVGSHTGGSDPFSIDVTDALREGDNELVVRVVDATEGPQLRGKQTVNPRGIWYTQVSGIWQTVWIEQVAPRHIRDLKIVTEADSGSIVVRPALAGTPVAGEQVQVVVSDGGQQVAQIRGSAEQFRIQLKAPKLWSPADPQLYDLTIRLLDRDGRVMDEVESYTGIRSLGKTRDADGHLRFTLNGEVIFHWGTLDQGWWPDGLLTPPSDQAMRFDIEMLKSAGFNMIRKHIKVEPRRYYYHCDVLGMMVWQDQVSGGEQPPWTRLSPDPVDAQWSNADHSQFMHELEEMVDSLENHPSIVVWVPFNEAWGQHRTMEVGRWMQQRDPTRLVNIASGGNFWPVGDIVDHHSYPHPEFPFDEQRYKDFIKVVGEFGGHGLPVEGHLWDAGRRNWGYGSLPKNVQEYEDRYRESLRLLNELRRRGIAAGIYTQTTDVEGEINGLMTYDRKQIKIPPQRLAEIHRRLLEGAANVDAGAAPEKRPEDDAQRSDQDAPVPSAATTEKAQAADGSEATDKPEAADKPEATDKPEAAAASASPAIAEALQDHQQAVLIKSGWIRDPYIMLGPDNYFYLTGTTPLPDDSRQVADPYNTGLGDQSIVGWKMQVWRSRDLVDWQSLGTPYTLKDGVWFEKRPERFQQVDPQQWRLWAPELHPVGDRWAILHTSPSPVAGANLSLTRGPRLQGPFDNPLGDRIGRRHDPSLFQDDDGTRWLIWGATQIAPLKPDFSGLAAEPVKIGPAGETRKMGHEGCLIRKIGGQYVLFGTGWSTGQMRKGSYNLYYATADAITGPYSERRFAGRFLGHGTPFRDKRGRWWCTAFYNADEPPLSAEGIRERHLGQTAQTINQQGVTIVPLEIRTLASGELSIKAKDPAYAVPGPDEAQRFSAAEDGLAADGRLEPAPIAVGDTARRLHNEAPVIDGHNDLPWAVREAGGFSNQLDIARPQPQLHTDIPRLRQGGVGAQFWSVYVPVSTRDDGIALRTTLEQIALVKQMVDRYSDAFEIALGTEDIERIRRRGKIASLIGVEGGHSIENSLSVLRQLYAEGARYMTLTHSATLDWADASTDQPRHGGLSPFGEAVVLEMNRLGMLVDISHVSADCMRHTLRVTQAPVIFSHSSAAAIANHPRNVPDDVLRLTAQNGGVVMINFFTAFVDPQAAARSVARAEYQQRLKQQHPGDAAMQDGELKKWEVAHPPVGDCTAHEVLDHIEHVIQVAGIDHVGLGSDFDGVPALPEQLEDVSTYPVITQGLLDRGYSEQEIRKVLGENVMRVLRQAEQVAQRMQQQSVLAQ